MRLTSLAYDSSLALLGALAALIVERACKSRWLDLVMVVVAFAAGLYMREVAEDCDDSLSKTFGPQHVFGVIEKGRGETMMGACRREKLVVERDLLISERDRLVQATRAIESRLVDIYRDLEALDVDEEDMALLVSIDRAVSRESLSPKEAQLCFDLQAQGLIMVDMRAFQGSVGLAWALTPRGREVVRVRAALPPGEQTGG